MNNPAQPTDARLVVTVVRTGGVAGIRRRWSVEPVGDEAPHWVKLIEQCPWDAPCEANAGADRFVWSIHAQTPEERHRREVSDSELTGPWRELVDAVRAASG